MTGRSDYDERRSARIDRLRARAEKKRKEGEARLTAVDRIARQIPLGQPILVGHHSERHARRDAKRIENGMRRGITALREADELERRAGAAETNDAVSSDDPEALGRLKEKLEMAEAHRDRWKAINKALRSKDRAVMDALELTDEERRTLRFSDFGTGYIVKNAGAEVRRLKVRIEELTAKAKRPAPPPEAVGDIVIDEEENRVRLRFPSDPKPDVIAELHSHGFRWSRTTRAWQRHASEQAWYWARWIARKAASAV